MEYQKENCKKCGIDLKLRHVIVNGFCTNCVILDRDLKFICESRITLNDVKVIKQNSKLTSLKWRGICFAYAYELSQYVILVNEMNANFYYVLKSGKDAEVMRNKYHLLIQKW